MEWAGFRHEDGRFARDESWQSVRGIAPHASSLPKKNGYSSCGEMDDHPIGASRTLPTMTSEECVSSWAVPRVGAFPSRWTA
jgi:hypothetical protein